MYHIITLKIKIVTNDFLVIFFRYHQYHITKFLPQQLEKDDKLEKRFYSSQTKRK